MCGFDELGILARSKARNLFYSQPDGSVIVVITCCKNNDLWKRFFFCFICREMLQRNTSHLAERASIKIFQLINTVIG